MIGARVYLARGAPYLTLEYSSAVVTIGSEVGLASLVCDDVCDEDGSACDVARASGGRRATSTVTDASCSAHAPTSNDRPRFAIFRWRLRVVDTVSGEDGRKCSGKPRTV